MKSVTMVTNGPRAENIDSTFVLSWHCPDICDAESTSLVIRLPFATYCKDYKGDLSYLVYVGGVLGEPVLGGSWEFIADNSTQEIRIDNVHPAGRIDIVLRNSVDQAIALWCGDDDTGMAVRRGDTFVGYCCCEILCDRVYPPAPSKDFEMPILTGCGIVHTSDVHGGVRRYYEIGNALVDRGHWYEVRAGQSRESSLWLPYRGKARAYDDQQDQSCFYDFAMTGAHEAFDRMVATPSVVKVVLVVAKFYADRYKALWDAYGDSLLWVGVADGWNDGMEEIDGVTIPGGVNTRFFRPLAIKSAARALNHRERLRVGFYARQGVGRGVERVLELAQSLEDVCDFVGFDANGYNTVTVSGSNVSLRFNMSQDDLRSVYRSCDIVVSAMHQAGWNNVIAESMGCGCVPIATPAGTGDLIVDGQTGYMCDAQEFETQAAECIAYLASNRDVLDRMSRSAHDWVQQYSWGIFTDRLVAEIRRRLWESQ